MLYWLVELVAVCSSCGVWSPPTGMLVCTGGEEDYTLSMVLGVLVMCGIENNVAHHRGGGIFVQGAGYLNLSGVSFKANKTGDVDGGGDIYNLGDVVFSPSDCGE